MRRLDRELLAEKAAVLERHLARIAERLPAEPGDFRPMTDASDSVILHLWQAIQTVLELAVSACIHFHLETPQGNGEAFQRLAEAGLLDPELAISLVRSVRFHSIVDLAYDNLDIAGTYRAASEGPADLRAFLAALQEHIQ